MLVTRSYTWDETRVRGKSAAETALRQSLSRDLALRVLRRIAADREFGDAGNQLVIEERLDGQEASVLAMTDGRTAAETRNIMEAFETLLAELDMDFGDVVQGSVYLADIGDYGDMNQVYGEYFPEDPPARVTMAVKELVGSAAIEISFIAVRR